MGVMVWAWASVLDERFAFLVEWHDALASLMRRYHLFYYVEDSTLEMYDIKNRRTFLKRTRYEDIELSDLYIGATVTVYSRQLHVIDYGDEYTAQTIGSQLERTLALIKPDAYISMGKIVDEVSKAGLSVAQARMVKLTERQAASFYAEHAEQPWFGDLVGFMTSDAVIALELAGPSAISKWRALMGATDPAKAEPGTIRAKFGHNATANGVHGSDSAASAARELEFFFSGAVSFDQTAVFDNCTAVVIKPHAVLSGDMGPILDAILYQGFEISALQMFRLSVADAEEFLEVYKGMVPEYSLMVEQLTSGPCLALEIRAESAVAAFRDFAGPVDPQVAAAVRPDTLRARFGVTTVKNAIHCTDLETDGELEVAYFSAFSRSRAPLSRVIEHCLAPCCTGCKAEGVFQPRLPARRGIDAQFGERKAVGR
ncbi:nucleoside diphosphate kinase [Thecamonas trahens ATCC 50062]|uniref:Nucleoside diphosphate kinase n=1 Tax=Thecamonas trahens ATCC 50062 TaxID=461836 RepID=A0A0L0DHW9_THETB|nr:nucleoside diphosphate kinase [Thecamonas trahens ATCC 50062]KNC50898.1 nucleoside diphosphate kinase [Thecamonas trahens ATCC 50062]|eukprot:XP_013756603.1 nucleoside diphosphate kinase [Thecamonas trahens ATCC 50062]